MELPGKLVLHINTWIPSWLQLRYEKPGGGSFPAIGLIDDDVIAVENMLDDPSTNLDRVGIYCENL